MIMDWICYDVYNTVLLYDLVRFKKLLTTWLPNNQSSVPTISSARLQHKHWLSQVRIQLVVALWIEYVLNLQQNIKLP